MRLNVTTVASLADLVDALRTIRPISCVKGAKSLRKAINAMPDRDLLSITFAMRQIHRALYDGLAAAPVSVEIVTRAEG